MDKTKNAKWWNKETESSWDRSKEAFHRDWEQTKHDFGADVPDLKQNVNDTVKQAAGSEAIPPGNQPNYEEYEPALRFGYGAYQNYGKQYNAWDDKLESQLSNDWQTTYGKDADWKHYRTVIHRGWDYGYRGTTPGPGVNKI
jgi:hypothetical protein